MMVDVLSNQNLLCLSALLLIFLYYCVFSVLLSFEIHDRVMLLDQNFTDHFQINLDLHICKGDKVFRKKLFFYEENGIVTLR